MVNQLGKTGFDVDEIFYQDLGVMAELPTLSQLVFVVSIGNTAADVDRLILAFQNLANQKRKKTLPIPPIPKMPKAHLKLTPREAFFSPNCAMSLESASGRICTELISPYPPGIPIICPGEEISLEVIDFLKLIKDAGGVINGCSDRTMATIKVVI